MINDAEKKTAGFLLEKFGTEPFLKSEAERFVHRAVLEDCIEKKLVIPVSGERYRVNGSFLDLDLGMRWKGNIY